MANDAEIRQKPFTAKSRAEVYQAVGALIYMCGLSDEPDAIRILDMIAYGATQDGTPLLPWPRDNRLQDMLKAQSGAVFFNIPRDDPA